MLLQFDRDSMMLPPVLLAGTLVSIFTTTGAILSQASGMLTPRLNTRVTCSNQGNLNPFALPGASSGLEPLALGNFTCSWSLITWINSIMLLPVYRNATNLSNPFIRPSTRKSAMYNLRWMFYLSTARMNYDYTESIKSTKTSLNNRYFAQSEAEH